MHKFVILLVVACGMNCGGGDSLNEDGYSTGILKAGIKKNEVGANGRIQISKNLRNPVLERLFRRNENPGDPKNLPEKSGERKIRQIQPLTVAIDRNGLAQVSIFQPLNFIKSKRQSVRSLDRTTGQNLKIMSQTTRKPFVSAAVPPAPSPPSENPFNYVITRSKGGIFESVVNSQVVRVRSDPNEKDVESDDEDERDYQDGGFYHEIETYPATAFVINIFNRDGSLKSSVTHFRPNLPNFLVESATGRKQAYDATANHMTNRINFSGNYLGYPRAMPPTKFPFHTIRVPDSDLNVDSYSSTGLNNLRNNNNNNNNEFNSSEPVVCNASSQTIKYRESIRTAREKPEIKKEFYEDGDVSRDRLDSKYERFDKGNDYDDRLDGFVGKFGQKDSEIRKSKRSRTNSGPLLVRRITKEKHSRNLRDTTSVIMLKDSRGGRINVTVEQPLGTMTKGMKIGKSDLILRKGGIAIAGPGGAATAYTGGTAIVGPYGTVYKSPEGTAILGPFGKIVNITDDTDFKDIIKMHGGTEGRYHRIPQTRSEIPPSGFQTFKNLFSYITNRPIQVSEAPRKRKFAETKPTNIRSRPKKIQEAFDANFREIVEDAPFDEVKGQNETFLIFRPKSKAEAGKNGIAISAPVSHAILFPGHKTQIYFEPEAVASAGPSGFAHAHSDLFVSYASSDGATSPQH